MVRLSANGYTIELPSPESGDEEAITLPKIIKKTLTGKTIAYKAGVPRTTLTLDFKNMNRPKVLELIKFFKDTRNKNIIYDDYKNKQWIGRITNDLEAVHAGHYNNPLRITFEVIN